LDPGAFGTLGVGGGFALGAKAVYPDRPVVILWGDGSSGYSLMEFDTFVRHKLPVVALIGNDACWFVHA
jgi:thiamine pyrophosphate-dependent acetolactate synthase large subunit-like protein